MIFWAILTGVLLGLTPCVYYIWTQVKAHDKMLQDIQRRSKALLLRVEKLHVAETPTP